MNTRKLPPSLPERLTQCLRRHRTVVGIANLIAIVSYSTAGYADTLYKTNSGTVGVLNSATTTPTVPAAILQNYAEGTAFTAGDVITFNNLINSANTSLIAATGATTLSAAGLVLDGNTGAVTINNALTLAQGLTIGGSGIDMTRAGANLTFANNTTGSLTIATSANQTWSMRTGRTLSLAAVPVNLANNVLIQGAGTVNFGNATAGNAISGSGNLTLDGAQSGGAQAVSLSGNNSAWTGAVTVGSSSFLRAGVTLNIDQAAAAQNKLADAQILTINNATVNLLGTSGGTEVVSGVSLGRGLNAITRTAGTGILQANSVTRGLGAAVNFGNIATTGPSHVTLDNLNTSTGQIGAWAVGINGTTDANWIKTAASGTDLAALALSGTDYTTQVNLNNWTAATQNIVVNAATTASTASRTIGSLKLNTVAIASLDIGVGNTLTINDGANGGGIIGVGNFARVIGHATNIGQGSLTAGAADDSINDTLYVYNLQNTTTINNVIRDNNTGVGTDSLHFFAAGNGATVTVTANNTYTGGTTIAPGLTLAIGANGATHNDADLGTGDIVNHGTLVLSKTTAATLAQMTLANNITGTGGFTINRGTALLSGVNDYSGPTTVSASTTLLAGSATGISTNSRMLLNASLARLDLNSFDVSSAALRGDVSDASVLLGTKTLTLSGSELANSSTAETLSLGGAQNYQGGISGAGNLIKNGGYLQVFTAGGALTYTGTTTVNAGTLQFNKPSTTTGLNIAGTGLVIANSANITDATASVNLSGVGSTWQVNNGFNQAIGSLTGVANSRISLPRGAASTNLLVTDNGAIPVTFAGVVQETGAGANGSSFTKAGTNTLILTGGNNYSGATSINNGTLQIGAANLVQVIPDRSAVILADVATASLDLNGNSETIGSLSGGGALGGNVLLGAGNLTLGLDNSSPTAYSGVISGAGGLNKVGSGTQTLAGANTFTGAVNISNFGGQSGGGLTLGLNGSLADSVMVRNAGWNTAFSVTSSDTIAAVTGTRNTMLNIEAGAVLTSTYTNGAVVVGSATADTDSTAGRIIRLDGSITNPQVGMLVSGTSIPAGSYIVQVLDSNHVLINTQPTPTTSNTALSSTLTSVLDSAITGMGGFTKDGAGLLILSGNSNHTGNTVLNNGDIQVGGLWNGQKFAMHDTLSDTSQIVFSAVNTTNLNFANSATALLPFERVGSLSGGAGVGTSIFLQSGSTTAAIAIGSDNSTTTFNGRFMGPTGANTWVIKEGDGVFTWNNPTGDVFDGVIDLRAGGFKSLGAGGLDGSNIVRASNNGVTFTNGVTDSFAILEGGAGVGRVQASTGHIGALYGNHISGTGAAAVIDSGTIMTLNSTTNSGFNGTISGAGGLTKIASSVWQIYGPATLTGETRVDVGTLRTGVLSGSAGLGSASATGLTGSLSSLSGLRITGGVLDINGTNQTAQRFNANSSGGTVQLVNGALTLADQNTQTVVTAFTGNLNSVLNINASAAATLSLTGNSTGFGGTINVANNAALTLNRTGGALNSVGLFGARINLNGTGTQLTVTLADTIGSLAGSGNAVLTQGLTLREARSGTVSASGYAGNTSGAGSLVLSGFGGLTLTGNNAHSGGTSLSSNSSINLNYASGSNILPSTGALTLAGGSINIFSSASVPTILESVASTNLNAGASSISSFVNFNAETSISQANGTAGINLGTITRVAGGTLNVATNAAAATNANLASGILGGYATVDGSTWAVANGAATAISGLAAGSYVNTFGAGLHTDVISSGAGGTSATLRFNTLGAFDVNSPTVLETGGILVTSSVGTNASTVSGALSSTINELIIHQHNPLGDLILSNIAGTNTILTTAGAGKIQITNNVAGNGTTNIGYGYLQLGDNTVGGSASGMVGTGVILNNGTLGVNRNNAVTLGAVISGTGNFEQRGSGTTTLSATNTFSGRVTINAGVLEITNNAGLGLAATSPTNRWANLTSINTGGTLLINVAAGGAVSEFLNLAGGTLDLRSTLATTLASPIVLNGDSKITVSNAGATAVSHIISGEILAAPGADLTIDGVVNATPSTLILSPSAVTGSRWEKTVITTNGRLQIGTLAGSRGFLGTGDITNDGFLAISTNDNFVIGNNITGAGTLALYRNSNYLTGDLTGFSGPLIVSPGITAANVSAVAELGNDTYANSFGSGPISLTANSTSGTSGSSSVRTHMNQDIVMSNTFNLTPAQDGTNAKNAQIIRAGIGNLTLDGTINLGLTNAGVGTQRNVIQTEAGGKLFLNATIAGVSANNLLNIVNNGTLIFGGSASQTYNGILSGAGNNGHIYIFNNSGTTTLTGVNSFNTAHTYLRQGTLAVGTGGVNTIQDDNDMHILSGATLSVLGNETIGLLYGQRGSMVNIASGATLTLDDNASQLFAGSITGSGGNLNIGANTDNQTNHVALYGTNTATGTLNIGGTGGTTSRFGGIQTQSLTNAIGSFSTINLGVSGGSGGFIDYVGSGETFANNINLGGGTTPTTNRITANGNGALIIAGNLTLAGGNSTLQLTGQTGGYFNPISNHVTGAITEGSNVLTLSMPGNANDDRFGITGRWVLTNGNNDFSGNVTVNVGMLELTQLGNGAGATSSLGDLTATRTITLGNDNFDGRRYDIFGNGDQLGSVGATQGTNVLNPSGDIGTIIFNDATTGTATFGSNISWTGVTANTANTTGMQLINNGAKTIVINGTLGSGATGAHQWIFDGSNTAINTINGVISNPTTSQSTSIIKEGAGTWRINNTANTFNGTTSINNGILEISGGGAILDSNTIAISADGGDGFFSGVAKLRVINSETIGHLTGDILTEAEILSGQTLTISGSSTTATLLTMNGLITGAGGLTRSVSGALGTFNATAKNTYTGITTISATGAATANAVFNVWHLADGGSASGIGQSPNAASNLVFGTDSAGDNGGVLAWNGFTDQSTDRLFTMGLGVAGARINAVGTVVGTTAPTLTFSNTGAIAFTGSGTRTLTLGGATISDNVFRPQITDGGGATSLIKADAGLWLINPAAAGNSYTGGTTITGGTLAIQAGNALGSGTITINGAAGIGLEVRGGSGITLGNNITNATADGGINIASGANILSGILTLTNQIRFNVESGASVDLNHATTSLAGSGVLMKSGNGTMILSGVNTATGATIVRNGVLELNYSTNNSSKLADAAALTLGGISALTVPGIDSSVGGQSKIEGQNGGVIHLSGGSHTEVVSATTIDQGANAITRALGSTSVLRMNVITRSANQGTIDFGASGIAQTDTNNVNGILGGYATVAKTDWATSIATGAADTPINALTALGYNNGLAVETFGSGFNTDIISAAATTGASTTTNSLRFNANQATTLTLTTSFGTVATSTGLQSGGILVTPSVGAFDTIITGAPLQNAAATANLETIIHQHNTQGVLEINSVIQNNTLANAQGLTKTGAGKLILSGLNTFSGALNLYEGEIQVGGTAAAQNTPTNAYLSGVAVGTGNASSGWNLALGTTLRFLTTNTTIYNTPAMVGDGSIILDAGNTGVFLFDDDNTNFYGDITFSGGTIRVNSNNNALGNVRGLLNINNSVNFIFNDGRALTKVTNYSEGTTFNLLNNTTTGAGTFSGVQRFNNTTTAGLNFNVPAPTSAGIVGLNINGVIYGSNGFTKSGNGILQISANNFSDVYDGYTGINKTPTLNGQINVAGGVLYVGGTRALGAFGVGNETIVAAGASLDLRGSGLNLGDDSNPSREIIKIQGTGFNNTGALRNSANGTTGVVSFLTLDGNATISSGGTSQNAPVQIATFDTHLSNANNFSNAFTRNQPVISGGGFDLTIQGSRNATDNVVLADPSFSSALNQLIIREGSLRVVKETTAPTSFTGLMAADFTNGIEIGYGGATLGDLTNSALGLGANVGARLYLLNQYGQHNTVNITMNGILAATNNGTNFITVDFNNIPDGSTYLDGTLTLTGNAIRNVLQSDSNNNFSVVEQGNLTGTTYSKLIIGGVVQGTGGFTKIGAGEVRLTNSNTFTGDVNVLRFNAVATRWENRTYKLNGIDYTTQGLAEGWAESSLTLNGPNGAISSVGSINLQRRGMITLDNTGRLNATSGVIGANNNNRINDSAAINFSNGWLRLNTGTVANTETLGTVNINAGTNIIDIYGTDGSGVNTTLTINTLNRTVGGVVRFTNLDASSTFSGSTTGDSAKVVVNTLNAPQLGGGGAANTTTMSIVQGALGGNIPMSLDSDFRLLGFNNGNISDNWNQQRNLQFAAGSHFLTYDGTTLRPLDNDEYFTPTSGILNPTTTGVVTQNVNLSDVITIMSEDTTINALRLGALTDHDGTGATSLIDHHGINLHVDGTLKISSGMISSGYWTVGNTASAATTILGGSLDFNGKEAIINNQNAFYRLTDGTLQGGALEIRSAITNALGLTKTGFQQVTLDGANTYSGVTTINDGTLFLRNGRSAAGIGGIGNGIVITGNGGLNSGNGIQVGSPTAREDVYVGILQGDNQILRVDNDVTQWFSNITIDNVDIAGHTLFTPRIRADNSATSIINGNIGGGLTAISNDVLAIDSRVVQFDSSGNNIFILRGQIGDKLDANGNAVAIANTISTLPTLAGVRTNENEVLRVNLTGGSDETNLMLERNYNAVGRLTIGRGTLIANYDPSAADGAGFWTTDAISKIPNADSTTTAFNINGGTSQQGFILGNANNLYGAVFLARANQVFNMASWTMVGTGAKHIGGLNESGSVMFGSSTIAGTLTAAGATPNLYASDGGTVVFDQRITGNVGTGSSAFAFVKQGRGTVILQNTVGTASDASFVLAGGNLLLNHSGATPVALVGTLNARFDGGTLISQASSLGATTIGLANNDAADRVLNFNLGGSEIVARTTLGASARNMVINMGNANANNTTSTLTRALGATANLVEDQSAGGTAQITLNFNASTTAAVKNQVIPWATYGTLSRTATDFAMSDQGAGNDVRAYGRATDEFNNNVATWGANQHVSENGGAGFNGSLAGSLTLGTLRFDSNADSLVNLGTNVLTIAGNGLASSSGAVLISSNVGSANKTIIGTGAAAITTTGGRNELIFHHYGTGNLNVNVPITGANSLTIAGPSTTNVSTIGTTGAVVLGATNTYSGQTFVNGSVLSFSNVAQLGTNTTATAITLNGGTLRYTGNGLQSLGAKGVRFEGNGGTIDVSDGAGELYVDSDISSTAQFRGDLIKVGAGTLTLNGLATSTNVGNASFLGLIDVREGTLRVNGDVGNNAASATQNAPVTMLGSSLSYADGTIFRPGTNFAIQMGNANDSGDWFMDEWLTFKGNNYVSVGTINTQTGNVSATPGFAQPNNERQVNLGGVITLEGTTTFDVVGSQTLQLNRTNVVNVGVTAGGYLTGNGSMIKDGAGTMILNTNNPDFTGSISVVQGRLTAVGQADVFGTGWTAANGNKVITLGSNSRQGIAELALTSEAIHGHTLELNHNIDVVYNPAQAKRLLFETFSNGSQIESNGTITLNDNLNIYINDAAETGGSQNYVNMNGKFLDGSTTSGNLIFASDDTGGANDNSNGRTYNYLVLKNDNSGWTGDVRVSVHTSFDQDETAILRLEHAKALTAANDVDMGFNSMLQVGGGARTIGALSTNGGTGPFIGDSAGGTMGASTNGVSVIIENAAVAQGTLTITQSTPVAVETPWNAYFRDGKLNSEFFAPGVGPTAAGALNLVKAGNGWATITTDNAYTGTTTVSGGILQVGRNGVGDTGATTAAGFTSAVSTTVAGTGMIQGVTIINGNLKPGDEAGGSMGTLTINGNTTLGSTSMTSLQVQRASYTAFNAVGYTDANYSNWIAGLTSDPTYSHLLNDPVTTSQHDQLIVNGSLTAGGKITLVNNGYNPTAGDVFKLMDWTSISGSFNVGGTALNDGIFRTGAETGFDLDLFELGSGFRWDVSLFNSAGIIVVVVPEPGRAMLMFLGLMVLFFRRRRQH